MLTAELLASVTLNTDTTLRLEQRDGKFTFILTEVGEPEEIVETYDRAADAIDALTEQIRADLQSYCDE